MRLKVLVSRTLAVSAVVLLAWGISVMPTYANCSNPLGMSYTGKTFVGCGNFAEAYWWVYKLGVQRGISSTATTGSSIGTGGVDSGFYTGLLTSVGGGVYAMASTANWGNAGVDGCIINTDLAEADAANCNTGGEGSNPVSNWIISGRNSTDSYLAQAAVLSVDFGEPYGSPEFAQCGALSIDGDPCGADADAVAAGDTTCQTIPRPVFASLGTAGTDGTTFTLTTPLPTNVVPIVDDCNVAMSRDVTTTSMVNYGANCPRDLDGGFQLMYRRDSCSVKPLDTHVYGPLPGLCPGTSCLCVASGNPFACCTGLNTGCIGNRTATTLWKPFYPEDLNYDGVLAVSGEDGTHGNPANGLLDPVIFSRTTANNVSVWVQKIPLAADCIYLGLALRADPHPVSLIGTTTVAHEVVYSPFLSMNTNPINAAGATAAADRVMNIAAGKSAGKANVSWDTSLELSVAGFNLIGVKKGGASVQMNASLIPAKNGTTGESASYSVSLKSGDLKGSTAVYVELVKTNGAKERFGPASF